MSYYGNYHVFEPRPGELARDALEAFSGALLATEGTARYRLIDHDDGVVMTGTRDECLDAVELAWWRVEAATFRDERVAAGRARRAPDVRTPGSEPRLGPRPTPDQLRAGPTRWRTAKCLSSHGRRCPARWAPRR